MFKYDRLVIPYMLRTIVSFLSSHTEHPLLAGLLLLGGLFLGSGALYGIALGSGLVEGFLTVYGVLAAAMAILGYVALLAGKLIDLVRREYDLS